MKTSAERKYDNANNEGTEGYNPISAKRELVATSIEAADFAKVWSKEITISRRASWNALVKSGKLNNKFGKIDSSTLDFTFINQGWNLNQLKRAIKLYNL